LKPSTQTWPLLYASSTHPCPSDNCVNLEHICHDTLNTHYITHKSAAPCVIGNFSTTAVQRVSRAEYSRHLIREMAEVSTPFITTWKHPLAFMRRCEQATKHTLVVKNSIPDSETSKLIILWVSLDTPGMYLNPYPANVENMVSS
jgi:hypothetical protein